MAPVTIHWTGSHEQVDGFGKSLISQELIRHRGNVTQISERLGIPCKTLYDTLLKHSLYRDAFR